VLQALYEVTGGEKWKTKRGWVSAAPFSEWAGIIIDSSGRVTEVDLSDNNLCGNIPHELSGLRSLLWLDLHGNNLSGNIPHELSQLRCLQDLYLDNNNLSGNIPHELSQLSNLQELYLSYNNLSGKRFLTAA